MIVTDKQLLSKPCRPVDDLEEGLRICYKLRDEVKNHPNAIGLAANQIGINARVFIIQSKSHSDGSTIWLNMVNPVISDKANKVIVKTEGCLSFPGENIITERYNDVWVTSQTFGDERAIHFRGIEAICIQHELDHLDGITMHDREWKEK